MEDREKNEIARKVANKVTKRIIYIILAILAVVITLFSLGIYASVLKSWQVNSLDYYFHGRSAFYDDNYDEAIKYLSRVVKVEPDFADAYFIRGRSYYKKGKYKNAIDDYTRCIKYDPSHEEAYYWRGEVYSDLEDYTNAISDFSKAIELDPNDVHYYHRRGTTYYLRHEREDIRKSIYDFKKGCELGDDNSCVILKIILNLY